MEILDVIGTDTAQRRAAREDPVLEAIEQSLERARSLPITGTSSLVIDETARDTI